MVRALTFRRALVGSAAITAAMLVVLVFKPGGEQTSLVTINDTVQAIAPAIAAVACFAAARRSPLGGWRRGWRLLGWSALSWCAGQVVWTWYEMVRHIEAPFPSAADVGYLGAVPLAIAAVLAFPVHTGAPRFRAIVDGLITASGVLQVSWATVLGPTYRAADGSLLEQVIALAYPASDTAVLVVLLMTVTRVRAERRTAIWLVVGGLAALAMADGSFAYLAVNDSYGTGAVTDIGWISGYLLIALGAHRVVTDHRYTDSQKPEDRYRLLPAILPFAAVVGLIAVVATQAVQGEPLEGFLLWNALVTGILVVVRQIVVITENARLTQSLESTVSELAVQATHDGLTGLMNRRLLVEHLSQELAATRPDDDMVAVLFIDLDRFKVINDSLGHDAGDSALLAVVAPHRARRRGRRGRPLRRRRVRRGGPGARQRRRPRAGRPHRRHHPAPLRIGSADLFVTGSIGLAVTKDRTVAPGTLIRDADLAMYVAKERGRARVEQFDVALRARPLDRLDIEAALHHAVERDEFVVLLQPIVDLSTGALVAVEALVRWEHPTRGLLAPEDFLDAAEETGVVVAMGARVLDLACLATGQLAERIGHMPALMVNVSARQLDQGDLPNLVRRTLKRHGMTCEQLCLEVTEGVIASAEATVGVLLELRAMGVGLAVDDFGTGYSSLSHLRRLPVGTLKIDKSFVRALGGDDGATQIVAAITHMARALGMTVVAEGVETHEQLAELQALGCARGQGYLIGRPGTPDDLAVGWPTSGAGSSTTASP